MQRGRILVKYDYFLKVNMLDYGKENDPFMIHSEQHHRLKF